MSTMAMAGIKACVFDAYGTLFDVRSAVAVLQSDIGAKSAELSALWRTKQLEYSWLRAVMGRHADFWKVTGDALDHALAASGVQKADLKDRLMQAYLALDPFPEVPDVLARLRRAGVPLAILSNGTPSMLEAVVGRAGLAGMFDAVLSVESAGVFKPHPLVYQLAIDHLNLPADAIAFQSSNAWDVSGAAAFGLRAVWINRFNGTPEQLPGVAERQLPDLAGLPSLVGV